MSNLFWVWLILGSLLVIAELLGTDYFLLFIGLSAIVTALSALVVGLEGQIVIFCILAIISIAFWFYRHKKNKTATNQDYEPNAGLKTLVGRESKVDSVESDNTVKIEVNDSVYIAKTNGNQIPKVGDAVKIIDFDQKSNRLVVELVEAKA